MPHYESTIHHNGLNPGQRVEINDLEREAWQGEIEAGFLVPVDVPGIGTVSAAGDDVIERRAHQDDSTADVDE